MATKCRRAQLRREDSLRRLIGGSRQWE